MKFYYTPVVQNPDSGGFEPAKDDAGVDVSAIGDLIGGIDALKLDQTVPRYVLACPDAQPAQTGWDEKTAEEVDIDYPDLAPVGS
jgi:hypothetical protein